MIEMLYMLLESIYLYGKLKADTEILIYTSTIFMNTIKKSKLYNEQIKFEINDMYNDIDQACKSRLNFFSLESSKIYSTVLYLDIDIIVKDDLNKIFCLAEHDILYVLEEGTIKHEWWGSVLFDHRPIEYTDTSAFTTGIMLFNNCLNIRLFFEEVLLDIRQRIYDFSTFDQPYIVYNAFKNKIYNNKILKDYAINFMSNVITYKNKTIYHFPGGPGSHDHKLIKMRNFLDTVKTDNFLESIQKKNVDIYEDVWTVSEKMRMDIFEFFKDKPQYKITEIGSYKGYTTRFLSTVFSEVYAIDNHLEWLQMSIDFNKDKKNIKHIVLDVYRDDWGILPLDADVVFIDAGRGYEECKSDILNSLKTFKNIKYAIFDDYGICEGVKRIVDELIEKKILIMETFIGLTDVPGSTHIVKDINEGVICRVNKNIKEIENRTYVWENTTITFLENFIMDAFGIGYYHYIDDHSVESFFGRRKHMIVFNDNYSEFTSVREDDKEVIKGIIFQPNHTMNKDNHNHRPVFTKSETGSGEPGKKTNPVRIVII